MDRRSEESESEQRIPPGPPLEGHPVIHESAAFFALLVMFQAEIVMKMREVISESLDKNCQIRRVNKVIQAHVSNNLPAEKDHVVWLLQGNP